MRKQPARGFTLRPLLIACFFVLAIVALILWRLADHDLADRNTISLTFTTSGKTVSGTVWLPNETPAAVMALVHGDGPQDRTSGGGYAPMINTLLDRQIAVASWDKPGIGQSDGNWLHQSMGDRTDEVRAVLHLLRQQFEGVPIGAMGFSQAGWVLPQLTPDDADFLVLVGAAVSWRDQWEYYTRKRLEAEGQGMGTIDAAIAKQRRGNEEVFGPDAVVANRPADMSEDRWQFIRTNRNADARAALAELDLPVLAIWGAEDLNVHPTANASIYQQTLARRSPRTQIIIWPEATHALLKSPQYNWQLTEDWSFRTKARFIVEGRFAFEPDALNTIAGWILGSGTNR